MSKVTIKDIEEKYPELFTKCYDFSIGDGWVPLIHVLCHQLKHMKLEEFSFLQIKEKFGGLRVYTNSSSEEVYALTAYIETLSTLCCDKCGLINDEVKTVTINHWLTTRCPEHSTSI